ncbi:polysulfide reductase NrfD, partial [bacterium]|nr:polysulfide reductase NrfD [bacterium]
VIAATVYIFHLEHYRPIVRPAILTAFLGYVAVAVGLMFDLGLPWHIWHPLIHWQHHSALFEVAWCVMLYLTVLALEFSPVVLERSPFKKIHKFLKKITLLLVIIGIGLSTLHQSSLGTLFTIMPFRLHPLWYSTLLPYLFLISAIGLGLCMVIAESVTAGWLYDHKPDKKLLAGLGKAASYVLCLYFIVRFADLTITGRIKSLFEGTWESLLFIVEILIGVLIPIVLFSLKNVREKLSGVSTAAFMVVFGFVFNRMNVSGISTITLTGSNYVPSWMEIVISIGVVSAACLAFMFFIENFSVYENDLKKKRDRYELPKPDPISGVMLDFRWVGSIRRLSLVFIFAIALGFSLLPEDALTGAKPLKTPVRNPRLVEVQEEDTFSGKRIFKMLNPNENYPVSSNEKISKMLLLDGDRNGNFVLFNHISHSDILGKASSCGKCHHMNKPFDMSTSCYECHQDMYLETNIFDHELHAKRMGSNKSCDKCHKNNDLTKNKENAAACIICHKNMIVENSLIKVSGQNKLEKAPSYKYAMHGLCITCHKSTIEKNPVKYSADFARCGTCHDFCDSEPSDYLDSGNYFDFSKNN